MSASVRASATASLPEISISCSGAATAPPVGLVTTAMKASSVLSFGAPRRPSARRLGSRRLGHAGHDRRRLVCVPLGSHALRLRVLPGNALGQRRPAELQVPLGELLLVLPPVPEAVGPYGRDL